MKHLLAFLLSFVFSVSALAQGDAREGMVSAAAASIRSAAGAPSGSCSPASTGAVGVRIYGGAFYYCNSGTWAAMSGGGGTTINSTNGQLPYRVNSTTFGDSAIASNALNSTYLSVTSGASGAGVIATVLGGGTNENLTLSGKGTGGIGIGGSDVLLQRDAANTLAQRNGTNAQAFRVYNTYTDGSNYERIAFGWSSNTAVVGTSSAGTGAARPLRLFSGTGNIELMNVGFTDFDRLQFGGTTASFPALKRSGAGLVIKVADDTAFSYLEVGGTNQGIYLRSSGANVKAPNNGQYIWVNNTDGGTGDTDTGLARAAAKVISLTDSSTAGGALRAVPDSPTQLTADQNNYQAGTGRSLFYRLSSDASRTITGFNPAGGINQDGELHYIINVGANNIVLANESASSTAANRFTNVTGSDITLAANEMAMLVYDNTSARWRAVKL